jgi:hypothetical protein
MLNDTKPIRLFHDGNRSTGATKQVLLWIVVAITIAAAMVIKLYRSGHTNLSFIISMSIAAVIAIAIVAPNRFSSDYRDPGDWSREIDELQKSQKDAEQRINKEDDDAKRF